MTMRKRTIWTMGHRPFVMGGDVYYPLGTEWDCTGPHQLGKGYYAWCAKAPNGRVFVSEASTGAFVGNGANEEEALAAVRKDIKEGDKAVMKQQVQEAAEKAKKIEMREPDFFWSALKCNT